MSGLRWSNGVGIAVGGAFGALVALFGLLKAPAPPPRPEALALASSPPSAPAAGEANAATPPPTELPVSAAPPGSAAPELLASASLSATAAASAPPTPSAPSAAPIASVGATPPLPAPTTREALMKAMLFCDQKKDFDECGRAAEALEKGTTGPADAEQAKRFRRIALTHLVQHCETADPHACFVLAAKYRAGTELPANPASAEVLEKRGLDLCRLRAAPECPSAP